jgi:predicted nucleotidyltransferase
VKEIRLFGSRARGDAHEYSDFDVLVVLDQRNPEVRAEILDIAARMMDQYGVLVATVLRSVEEWQNSQGYPFAHNLARDGIAL